MIKTKVGEIVLLEISLLEGTIKMPLFFVCTRVYVFVIKKSICILYFIFNHYK